MSQSAPPTGALYLLDTNILARLTEAGSPMHITTTNTVKALNARGALLFITPQNLIEFWNLATRPALKNGLGLTTDEAAAEVAKHKAAFRLLPDAPNVFPQWEELVKRYNVQGQQVHDTRLAAIALAYGITNILTFNFKDFRRFDPEGLTAVDPTTVPTP